MKFEFNHLEKSVLDSLSKKGRVYLVGGIVRDMVMYQKVDYHDVDVEIYDLEIDEIIDILSQYGKVNEVGKSFGILKLDCLPNFDFALPRIERKKGQTHREFEVEVHKNLDMKIACRRRDFTINAMAYNPTVGLIDAFDGIGDIERKLIKCVGVALLNHDGKVEGGLSISAPSLRMSDEKIELYANILKEYAAKIQKML